MTLSKAGFFRELRHGDPNGPSLGEAQGELDEAQQAAVLRYLESATTLAATPGYVGDALDPVEQFDRLARPEDRRRVDVAGDLAYYVRRYRVGLPEPFLRHMAALGWVPPVLSSAELDELTESLLGPA